MKHRRTTSLLLLAIITLWSIAMLSACGSANSHEQPYDTSPTTYDLTVTVIEKCYVPQSYGRHESFILLVRVVHTPDDLRPFTISVPITTYVKAEVGKVMELPGHP
jgi:hypothetical protein